LIGLDVVAANLKDLGHKANAWPALDLDDDIERVSDIGFDRGVRDFYAAL
jgi:hypothetical protein